jgi:GNAT superfamily N-acetyltransferase
MSYEKEIDGYLISADKSKLQLQVIHHFLNQESYWAKNVSAEVVNCAVQGSVCFGVYDKDGSQIGFARVITDLATFGYIGDVFILKEHRGKGLSKALMQFIMDYPPFKKFRRLMLATRDAHQLYEKFGFHALKSPDSFMEIKFFEKYPD